MQRSHRLSPRLGWLLTAALACAAQGACGEIVPVEEPPLEPPDPIDPPPPPPAIAPVTVTVLSPTGDGSPEPGATVLFVAPDGRLLAEAISDARGKAQAVMPEGGTVHAVRIETVRGLRRATVRTVSGVASQDVLQIGESRRLDAPSALPAVQMTGTFVSAGFGASHVFETECGVGAVSGTTITLSLRGDCAQKKLRLFGAAFLGRPGFVFTSIDLDVVDGGRFAVPNTWAPGGAFAVTARNLPAGLFSLGVNRYLMASPGASTPILPFGDFASSPAAGTTALSIPFSAAQGTRALVEAFISTPTPPSQLLTARTAALASSHDLDVSELEVPWLLAAPAVTATGAQWRQRDAGRPDVRLVQWTGVVRVADVPTTVQWTLIDDRVAPSFALPGLPPAFAAIDPTQQPAAAVTPLSASVTYVDHSELAGYAEARRVAFDAVVPPRVSSFLADRAYRVRSVTAASPVQ